MGQETILFKSKEQTDIQRVADFLHQLTKKKSGNQVILRQGTQEITLDFQIVSSSN
jgi:hypothetical protein